MTRKVLMVCEGGICRSPIAEAVLKNILKEADLEDEMHVESAALSGFNFGSLPEARALSVLQKHGIHYENTARTIIADDFHEFDYILGMDGPNMTQLDNLAPSGSKAKLLMLGYFGLPVLERIITDPYYVEGEGSFERVYQQCVIACEDFLHKVLTNKI